MKKIGMKALAFCFCFLMLLTVSVSAATDNRQEIAGLLAKLSIMNGYPDGELHPENPVTRAEFSKIAIGASPYKNQVASYMAVSPFSDVSYSHWAAPYVKLAVSNKLITGYPDATFRPNQTVLLEEAATICLRMLGYSNEDFGYSWPHGQLGLAQNIGLLDGVTTKTGENMLRGDVMTLIYNLLTCSPKNGAGDYLESISYKLAEDVVMIATSREDSSVPSGKVATTAGTYRIDESFDRSLLGMRGDVFLKNGDTLVCFVPYTQNFDSYVIYSVLDGAIITYDDGAMGELLVDDSTTVYQGTKTTSFSQVKSSLSMGDLLSVKRDDFGNVEYLSVRSGNVTGPVVVRSDAWHQELSVSENITVMRDGVKCTTEDIEVYDVVYYSPDLNMVLAYSKKVTGIYESASPNKDQLTQVTVSGVSYQVESGDAFRALSSGGQFEFGDTVTILLGKNGAVAGVASASATDSSFVGFFQSAGVKKFSNQAGDSYSNFYVQVVGADGVPYEYAAKRDYSDSTVLGQMVRVNLSGGVATLGGQKNRALSGIVDAEARTLGSYRLANNVSILDVIPADGTHNGVCAAVFLQQLDGVYLSSGNVLYYTLNSAGEISELFVKDVTGSCYQYGIVTKAESKDNGMQISGSYQYDVMGQAGSTATSGLTYAVSTGQPVQILSSGGRVSSMKALEKLSASFKEVTNTALVGSQGTEYLLSDKVVIYKKTSYDYTVMPISDLDPETYSISAYYDRSLDSNGRIRVIVAEVK